MHIAVLLNGPVKHDSRVIKVINSLALQHSVDLFYPGGEADDGKLFKGKVRLFPLSRPNPFVSKLLRHSFFYREFSFLSAALLKEHSRQKYDLVYANDLPCLWPAAQVKAKAGIRILYDSHEIYIETLNQFLPLHSGRAIKRFAAGALLAFMRSLGRNAERKLLKSCDMMITVNQSLSDYFKEKYGLKEVPYLLNCPPLEKEALPAAIDYRKTYAWPAGVTVIYHHGNFTRGKGLEQLLEAVSLLDEKYKLVLLGSGTLTPFLKERAKRPDLRHKVVFAGRVEPRQLTAYASAADIGINFLENINLSKSLASNNKLFEYIHAGLPVLSSDNIENQRVHKRFGIGEVTPLEPRSVARAIERMNDPLRLRQYREACREARKELNWNKQEALLLSLIRSLER